LTWKRKRARIAQRLLESLETLSEEAIESLWIAEAERRNRELDEDPSLAIPGNEVLREARARLRGDAEVTRRLNEIFADGDLAKEQALEASELVVTGSDWSEDQ